MTSLLQRVLLSMPFPDRLAAKRKERGLTQEELGTLVGLTKLQIYRYEKGSSQPTLDILKKLALHLNASLDELVFDDTERDPVGDLKLRFEQIQQMSPDDQAAIKSILDGMILKHQTKQTIDTFDK